MHGKPFCWGLDFASEACLSRMRARDVLWLVVCVGVCMYDWVELTAEMPAWVSVRPGSDMDCGDGRWELEKGPRIGVLNVDVFLEPV
jgi:hypothetical protein